MIATETREFIACDICYQEILELSPEKIELQSREYDICRFCCEKLLPILEFLSLRVGLDFEYRVKTRKESNDR